MATNRDSDSMLSFQALGTVWWLTTTYELDSVSKKIVLNRVHTFQNMYSRFDRQSLLSQLNNTKQLKDPPVELVKMLRYALDMYKKTDGLFNISVGAKLEQDGYGAYADSSSYISDNLGDDIQVTDRKITIADYIRLDFGGFGKGWLIDSLHDILNERGYSAHIINGGGDIRVGSQVEEIHIENPFDDKEFLGSVQLQNRALGVSSNKKRQWLKDGVAKHHIINPKSNSPAAHARQVATIAPTCLGADVFATLLLLTGGADIQKLAARNDVAYQIVLDDQRVLSTSNFIL